MFGWSKRERADREIKEITTWVLGQSVVQGSNFPPVGVFESRLQMQVALEACGFFLHVVDRLAYRPGDDRLREAVYDIVATKMVRTFSEMIFKAWAPSPLSEVEQDTLDFFKIRQLEYGNAARLIGETFNDLNSASWLAAHKVARAAEIGERDIRVMPIHTGLLNSLVQMDLAKRIKKVEACDLPHRSARLNALLIVMASAGVVGPGLAEPRYEPVGAFETASDLVAACFTDAPFSKKRACWGYILGVADMELAAHNICIPDHKEYDVPKLTDMVTRHLRASSGPFDLAAAPVVGDFFEHSFPCHKPAEGPIDAYWSLGRLRKECVREGPNSEKVLCNAYIVGAVDALQDLDAQAICIPQKTDTDDLVALVIRYIDFSILGSVLIEHSSDPPDAPAAQSLIKFAKKYFSCAANH